MTKVWFITGSSRGLGRSLAEAVLKSGDKLVATARNTAQLDELAAQYGDQVYPVALDVTDYEQVYHVVAEAVAHFGRIDVLVNNAGFGIIGAAEAYTEEQVRSQLETNLYAPIEITRAVLPYMRGQGSGRILQISSIGGRVGNPGLTMYQAAKFGLSGFTEALAKEVRPLGIHVTSVEPGGFRTDWAGASMTNGEPAYGLFQIRPIRTRGRSRPGSGGHGGIGRTPRAAGAPHTGKRGDRHTEKRRRSPEGGNGRMGACEPFDRPS